MGLPSFWNVIFAVSALTCAFYLYRIDYSVPEEFRYRTGDFIKSCGFDYEEHVVESEDGFVTTVFRIVSNNASKHPVPLLIQPGLFCSSDLVVLTCSAKDLPFYLASQGFDVWLGNFRGTHYSYAGPRANQSDKHLQNYGYHEQGVFDVAVTIDHILATTQQRQVDLMGWSVSCGSILALLSTKPEYNARVRMALMHGCGLRFLLANYMQTVAFYFMWAAPGLIRASGLFEPYPARPGAVLFVCNRTSLRPICDYTLHQNGFTFPQNLTMAALVITYFPSGNALGVLDHLMQLSVTDENVFRMRDWGPEENLLRYNTSVPPSYDVSKVTAYVKSYTAENDTLVRNEIAKLVFSQLPNYGGDFMIKGSFDHANFFMESWRSAEYLQDVVDTLSK